MTNPVTPPHYRIRYSGPDGAGVVSKDCPGSWYIAPDRWPYSAWTSREAAVAWILRSMSALIVDTAVELSATVPTVWVEACP